MAARDDAVQFHAAMRLKLEENKELINARTEIYLQKKAQLNSSRNVNTQMEAAEEAANNQMKEHLLALNEAESYNKQLEESLVDANKVLLANAEEYQTKMNAVMAEIQQVDADINQCKLDNIAAEIKLNDSKELINQKQDEIDKIQQNIQLKSLSLEVNKKEKESLITQCKSLENDRRNLLETKQKLKEDLAVKMNEEEEEQIKYDQIVNQMIEKSNELKKGNSEMQMHLSESSTYLEQLAKRFHQSQTELEGKQNMHLMLDTILPELQELKAEKQETNCNITDFNKKLNLIQSELEAKTGIESSQINNLQKLREIHASAIKVSLEDINAQEERLDALIKRVERLESNNEFSFQATCDLEEGSLKKQLQQLQEKKHSANKAYLTKVPEYKRLSTESHATMQIYSDLVKEYNSLKKQMLDLGSDIDHRSGITEPVPRNMDQSGETSQDSVATRDGVPIQKMKSAKKI